MKNIKTVLTTISNAVGKESDLYKEACELLLTQVIITSYYKMKLLQLFNKYETSWSSLKNQL